MAAMDFPNAPTVGQKYLQYTWDGEKWIVQGVGGGGGGGSAVYTSDTPPASAPDNSLWVETDTGMMFVRWNDSNSSQWVAIPGGIADAVRYSTPQTLTSAQAAQARANIWVTKKNYIINGGMQVSQENGGTAGTSAGYFGADQWSTYFNGAGIITTQNVLSPTPGGSPNRYRTLVNAVDTSIVATDFYWIYTRIEGVRCADLMFGNPTSAKTVTLQFGFKGPAGTYGVKLGNGADNRAYLVNFTITAGQANNDTVQTFVIPGDTTGTWTTDTTTGIGFYLTLASGRIGVAGWQGGGPFDAAAGITNNMAAAGTFELFDVSLTEGTVAPPFQVPDYASELALCQRYYWKNASLIVETGTAAQSIKYPVTMRANPTISGQGAGGGANGVTDTAAMVFQTTRGFQPLVFAARL